MGLAPTGPLRARRCSDYNDGIKALTPLDCVSRRLRIQNFHPFVGKGVRRPERATTPHVRLRARTHFDNAACSYSVAQTRHAFDLGAVVATACRGRPVAS